MRFFALFVGLLLGTTALGQQIDSIRYPNGHLYYHTYGKGEPVLILTGGPGAPYQQLEEVAVRLGKTHRAVLLEQRGTGRSQPVPYDTSTVNLNTAHADILRLMDHLKLPQMHLLGHSWGGMLAMSFAALHPARVRSLILVDSGPFAADRSFGEIYGANMDARLSEEEKSARRAAFNKGWAPTATPAEKEAVYHWELVPVLYDRTKVDSLMPIINKGGLNPTTGSMLFQSFMMGSHRLKAKLRTLKLPVNIIAGAQDPGAFMSYEIKLLMPHASLYWINRSGHFPMYEQPEAFYAVLSKVLAKK